MSKPPRRSAPKSVTEQPALHMDARLDARSLTLPAVTIISIIAAAIWVTWLVATERNRIDENIKTIATDVKSLASSMQSFAENTRQLAADRWTRSDMQLFCAQFETTNRAVRCPPIHASTTARRD